MSSSSDEDHPENLKKEDQQLKFMQIIKKFIILLNKSQVPSIKIKKEKAYLGAVIALKDVNQKFDKNTLSSKISRMKNDVKQKTDKNRTGNKKINLRPWERIMFDMMMADDNPTIVQVPGAISVGTKKVDVDEGAIFPKHQPLPEPRMPSAKRKSQDLTDIYETDETRPLTTGQLQRLVLLEQLQVLRLKKNKLQQSEPTTVSYINILPNPNPQDLEVD